MAKAKSVLDVMLGEAASGSPEERFQDMLGIASVIVNRARATGESPESIVGVNGQFNAFGKPLPKGAGRHLNLAKLAMDFVIKNGPVHRATYFATPAATNNLLRGSPNAKLEQVGKTTGHVYYEDKANAPIITANGVREVDASLLRPFNAPVAPRHDPINARGPAAPTVQAVANPSGYTSPMGPLGDRMTSDFGARVAPKTPSGEGSSFHHGVDMTSAYGRGQIGSPVHAVAPGVVTFAGRDGAYGNKVEITHADGVRSVYAHLGDPRKSKSVFGPAITVSKGQAVAQGAPIGILGNTGRSTGPHLHFEMFDSKGRNIDPATVINFAQHRDVAIPSPRASSVPTAPQAGPSARAAQEVSMDALGRSSPTLPAAAFAAPVDTPAFSRSQAPGLAGVPANAVPTTSVPGAPSTIPAAGSFGFGMGRAGAVAGLAATPAQSTSFTRRNALDALADERVAQAHGSSDAPAQVADGRASPAQAFGQIAEQRKAHTSQKDAYRQLADSMRGTGIFGLDGRRATPSPNPLLAASREGLPASAMALAGDTPVSPAPVQKRSEPEPMPPRAVHAPAPPPPAPAPQPQPDPVRPPQPVEPMVSAFDPQIGAERLMPLSEAESISRVWGGRQTSANPSLPGFTPGLAFPEAPMPINTPIQPAAFSFGGIPSNLSMSAMQAISPAAAASIGKGIVGLF